HGDSEVLPALGGPPVELQCPLYATSQAKSSDCYGLQLALGPSCGLLRGAALHLERPSLGSDMSGSPDDPQHSGGRLNLGLSPDGPWWKARALDKCSLRL
ncbi:hypothetical protein CYMTET_28201, partial [Cymbomonas tetramitiformis]